MNENPLQSSDKGTVNNLEAKLNCSMQKLYLVAEFSITGYLIG